MTPKLEDRPLCFFVPFFFLFFLGGGSHRRHPPNQPGHLASWPSRRLPHAAGEQRAAEVLRFLGGHGDDHLLRSLGHAEGRGCFVPRSPLNFRWAPRRCASFPLYFGEGVPIWRGNFVLTFLFWGRGLGGGVGEYEGFTPICPCASA